MKHFFKRIVVKIGSNVLTDSNGFLNQQTIQNLVEQLVSLRDNRVEVILVSSGAVASGRSVVTNFEKSDPVSIRQLLSSLGQVKLINTYTNLFANYQVLCSQVLVTKEDFRTRSHYLNMKNCLQVLLQNRIVPIVNENDVVSVTELMFTDNDELAGLIASMVDAEALFMLTNVDGVLSGDPDDPKSELIPEIDPEYYDFTALISAKKSNFGRGGMLTKCNLAKKVALSGVDVFIANGTKPHVLQDLLTGNQAGTHFRSKKKNTSNIKKWVAHSEGFAKGIVSINSGAKEALLSKKATSLLPIGITHIEGDFKKGDIIKIRAEGSSQFLGLGMAQYGYEKAQERQGLKNQKPLIHYDYLYLT